MNKLHTGLFIRFNLEKKYETSFHFYMAGCINQMIENFSQMEVVIAYKDVSLLSQELEFMRRQYWMINKSNEPEIYDRISMLSSFYNNNPFLTWEYPMMILTRTRKIFIRRFRRLRKMLSFDNSSDGGEQTPESAENRQGLTINILNDTYSDSSLDFSALSVGRECASFDSDSHNIYLNQEGLSEGRVEIEELFSVRNDREELNCLVIDFNDLDAKKTVDNFLQLKKRMGGQKRESLQNLYDKRVYTSIVIEDHLSQIHGSNSGKKLNRATEMRRIERRKYLNDRRKTIDNRITKDKEYQYSSKRKKVETVEAQHEQIFQKKQKIRDKAAELLNRVKNQDYTGGRKERSNQ